MRAMENEITINPLAASYIERIVQIVKKNSEAFGVSCGQNLLEVAADKLEEMATPFWVEYTMGRTPLAERIKTLLCLKYSKEKPTEPGWYWYRRDEQDTPAVVHIYSSFGEPPDMTFTGNDRVWPLSRIFGEWAGPILPPTE
jgi:hypothetical protein